MGARRMPEQDEPQRSEEPGAAMVEIVEYDRPIPPALENLPEHLREAAIRSWLAREEDYRYLAEH